MHAIHPNRTQVAQEESQQLSSSQKQHRAARTFGGCRMCSARQSGVSTAVACTITPAATAGMRLVVIAPDVL
jgi:hypothetical protein